jgi:hypothetical protein
MTQPRPLVLGSVTCRGGGTPGTFGLLMQTYTALVQSLEEVLERAAESP